ncbi:aminotransferase-like domain-containing protein [Rhizobium sp. PAMB 3182]
MSFQISKSAPTHPDIVWTRLFSGIDRNGVELNVQIRRALVYAIQTGTLTTGARLPSSRRLAALLNVARNTVTGAYQTLVDEGFLVATERQGIYVAPSVQERASDRHRDEAGSLRWQAGFAIRPSLQRQIDKPRDWLAFPYPFVFGQFDPSLFPTNNWREAVRVTSSVKEIYGWAGDQVDDDDPDLVEQLRVQVLPSRGIFADPGEIIVTLGSQQALSMLVQLMVGRDTIAGVEDPGYADLRNMVDLASSGRQNLNMDGDGVIVDDTFGRCDIAFLTVSHHCPTTSAMPLSRRQALLERAEADDVLIVEDDYEGGLSTDPLQDVPSLKSLDRTGRVVYVGSFSKALAPGLRIGYIVAPPSVVQELRVLRRLLLRHPPINNQRILATFLALGHYRQHMDRMSTVLKKRAQHMTAMLGECLSDCNWQRSPGAKNFWVEAPPGVDCAVLAGVAREKGVLIEPGAAFFADPAAGRRFFRLGFTAIAEKRIGPGLALLSEAISDCRS